MANAVADIVQIHMPDSPSPLKRTKSSPVKRVGHEQRRRDILESARVLLSEEGYEALSMRKVASRAGIHLKTLQHYFPSKELLIQSTLEFTDALYTNTSNAITANAGSPIEHFEEYIRYLLDDDKNQQTAGFFYQLWARAHVDSKTNQVMEKIYKSHIGNLEQLMESVNPTLPKAIRKQRAVIVAALIEGLMLFVGYGKKCPASANGVEKETISLCITLAMRAEPL